MRPEDSSEIILDKNKELKVHDIDDMMRNMDNLGFGETKDNFYGDLDQN